MNVNWRKYNIIFCFSILFFCFQNCSQVTFQADPEYVTKLMEPSDSHTDQDYESGNNNPENDDSMDTPFSNNDNNENSQDDSKTVVDNSISNDSYNNNDDDSNDGEVYDYEVTSNDNNDSNSSDENKVTSEDNDSGVSSFNLCDGINNGDLISIADGDPIAGIKGSNKFKADGNISGIIGNRGNISLFGLGGTVDTIEGSRGTITICGMDVLAISNITRGNITVINGNVGDIENFRGNLRIINGSLTGSVSDEARGNITIQ